MSSEFIRCFHQFDSPILSTNVLQFEHMKSKINFIPQYQTSYDFQKLLLTYLLFLLTIQLIRFQADHPVLRSGSKIHAYTT